MADYPATPLDLDSSREPVNFTVLNITAAGTVRGRNRQTQELFEFHALHRYITRVEAEAIYATWQSNKTSPVQLRWKDGLTYLAVFAKPPRIERIKGDHWMAEAWLTGYPA